MMYQFPLIILYGFLGFVGLGIVRMLAIALTDAIKRLKSCPPFWFHCHRHKTIETHPDYYADGCVELHRGRNYQQYTCCRCGATWKESL